ncbi:MAG: Uroporphyrin-III C/tetrapyrrole (Corrin/Porphyrin) methyltransferase [Ignavibacteria bacterium]|nr:Uroporphyrin-III C/tetrapyrrole (Corrin/Porphyrin) methyltransferase [Ignavibacteria bacterium]
MKSVQNFKPILTIVPTPIGNMQDITIRAIETLSSADYIACEDTRRTGMLLKHFDIKGKKLISCHDKNEEVRAAQIIDILSKGGTVALVSDAGTPGISDPAYRVVQAAIESGIQIISLPGATALIPALVASGLPIHNFTFLGFPPHKKGRKTFLENAASLNTTVVLYESSHRIVKLLGELSLYCGSDRKAVVAREISKIYEEYFRGTITECYNEFAGRKESAKGEFVIVIDCKSLADSN